jgi:hypothetical protein
MCNPPCGSAQGPDAGLDRCRDPAAQGGISDEERDPGCLSGEGRAIIAKVDLKFTLRAWQATFAGESTGAIAVAVEYPGDFGAFATAWSGLMSDKAGDADSTRLHHENET